MGEENFHNICANITACLTSSKRKVSISDLDSELLFYYLNMNSVNRW